VKGTSLEEFVAINNTADAQHVCEKRASARRRRTATAPKRDDFLKIDAFLFNSESNA